MTDYDVIIIGSGPAGLTAAIYAGRAMVKTMLIEGEPAGGQLMLTTSVENFPGFADGVLGPSLIQAMDLQARKFGATVLSRNVESVDFTSRPLRIVVEGKTYTARAIIVATGSSAKWLGLPSEERLIGRGVSGCATCDGYFFKDKTVTVVGGGDTAVEEALFLSRYASKVTLIHRRNRLRASQILQRRATANPKVSIVWDTVVEEVEGGEKVRGVSVRNVKTGERSTITCDGVFIAIGHQPNTGIFEKQLELDERGYIVVTEGTRSSVDGVFVAGDVSDHRYRQAITAAGEGCRAALDAARYLEQEEKGG